MLRNTFLHLKGIGYKKESELWHSGVHCWEDWEASHGRVQPRLFEEFGSESSKNGLPLFRRALVESDADFFAERMPRPEYYRIALTFPSRTLFLDIETTGLSIYYDKITVVGWWYGDDYNFIVQGDNDQKLRDVLADARAIVTFNGSLFDVPFLLQEFTGIRIPRCHVDLRFFAKRVGLSGGQKAIEKQLNVLTRPEDIADLKGENAPLLWSRYCWGDTSALDKLITYNRADVEGMKVIFDHVVQEVLNKQQVPTAIRNVPRFANGKRNLLSGAPSSSGRTDPTVHIVQHRPNVTLESLGVLNTDSRIRIIGIDLSGSERRPSGWCLLDGSVATTTRLNTDAELIATAVQLKPTLISIDSPLSIPRGRTSVRDDDPQRAYGIMRACERLLKKRGVNVYPCLIPSMQRLTERGMRLADTFRKMGIPVIESYPGAAQDIMGIPRKRASLELLSKGLENFGITGEFAGTKVSHDELDAITSAIVGVYFWSGQYEAIGNEDEEYLIIPDLKVDSRSWRSAHVIGLSGPICAGKTTTARFIESYGYQYCRYSQVLEAVLRDSKITPNRAELQGLGKEINKTKGQRWLGRRLLETVAERSRIVIDGLRFPEDHAFLRETFGPGFIHVHLTAPQGLRGKRYAPIRGSWNEFLKAENHEVESQVEKLRSLADVVIDNDGDIRDLEAAIKRRVVDSRKTEEKVL
jgi:uncharacterized protein YprB with RNaseH-like and TPR domain/predicted nuclease with RNAse H fold/dephospho-CoA kinase